ncbi:S49 family peptidase [Thioalkalivibrio thiocyanodenitrificans]|uniref:S49 family peptidase n=1 Tax=Thioalkalivibrio thiocyanodenitrificans TaxID=243063 RepID=UPI00037B1F11|nr:S49 family peptidase [Thioalkalivibrio thiocyanodenitrificans]
MSQETLHTELVDELLKERKRDRFWRNVRFAGVFTIVMLSFILNFYLRSTADKEPDEDYAAVVRIEGMISPDSRTTSAARLNPALNRAFSDERAKGVVLVINSPGGTPVQAALIHDRIKQLREEYEKPVVVVAEDMLTSGAYLIAMASDEIYVNRSTVVGSIGVIMQGFGFTGLMDTLGVERRVFTAGESKNMLDPFMDLSEEEVSKTTRLLDDIHAHFIDIVMDSRAEHLTGDHRDLFSGDYWTGKTAWQLGLVDGQGDLAGVVEERFGVSQVKDYTPRQSIFGTLSSAFSEVLSITLIRTVNELETPALR